jgi:hypothetical protein
MKDSEVRGIILKRLYEIRHANHGMIDVPDGLGITNIPPQVLGNCAVQLDEQGLIKFRQYMGQNYRSGHASITAHGVDVVEENAQSSIAIMLDQSVNIHGSSNVQVGQGNTQNSEGGTVQSVNAGETATVTPAKTELWERLKQIWKALLKWFGVGA